MQLNKTLLKFLLLFIFNLNHAQPGMKKLRNNPIIIFTINNIEKNKIKFITRDSVNFYSSNKQYSFSLSMNYIKYSNLNNVKDSISKTSPMSFNGDKDTFFRINPYGFSRYAEYLEDDKYAFGLIFGVSERERRSEPPYFYEYKSVVDINIKYKNKKMLVRLDFTKNLEKHFEEKKMNLSINFQEGNFEVTDPLKPEIKRSKKSKIIKL